MEQMTVSDFCIPTLPLQAQHLVSPWIRVIAPLPSVSPSVIPSRFSPLSSSLHLLNAPLSLPPFPPAPFHLDVLPPSPFDAPPPFPSHTEAIWSKRLLFLAQLYLREHSRPGDGVLVVP